MSLELGQGSETVRYCGASQLKPWLWPSLHEKHAGSCVVQVPCMSWSESYWLRTEDTCILDCESAQTAEWFTSDSSL